eukprot:31213-Pelagococcus_subviridis.AAC.1
MGDGLGFGCYNELLQQRTRPIRTFACDLSRGSARSSHHTRSRVDARVIMPRSRALLACVILAACATLSSATDARVALGQDAAPAPAP